MSAGWRVFRRFALAVLALYAVLSAMFAFVALTPDANLEGQLSEAAYVERASEEELERMRENYVSVRDLDRPLLDRYLGWLAGYTTLNWGWSYSQHRPVLDVLSERLPHTIRYVVPAVLLAVSAGVAIGTYSALSGGSPLGRLGRSSAYFGLGVPDFWLAEMSVLALYAVLAGAGQSPDEAERLVGSLRTGVLPTLVLATSLVAGQASFSRTTSMEYVGSEFVRLLKAKGAGKLRIARHVLRNAAIPLVSLFFTEMLGVLVLNVIVIEFAFGIPGFGQVSYLAIDNRDVPLVLGVTMVVAVVGVGGALVQDLAAGALDPRVEEDLYRAAVDVHQFVVGRTRRVAGRLPDGVVLLLADPDRFFRRRATGWVVPSAAVVLGAGLASGLPALVVQQAVRGAAASTPGAASAVEPVVSLAGTPVARTLLAWAVVGLVLHGVARLHGGRGRLRDTLRLAGWGWAPVLLFGVVATLATQFAVGAVGRPASTTAVGAFALELARHPLRRTVGMLGVAVPAWQGFLWLFAARHAHALSIRDAAVTAAVPTVAVLSWHVGVALWGTPEFVGELPLLPWLLGVGGPP